MIWNSNRKRNQFILYYKRGVNPRGWIYTPIHFRNVQHRKRYFYLRSGIFIQLWTTTRLRTIVLPFYFSQICMQRHDSSDVMTFYALFKTVCNTGSKFEKEKTNDKSSASKQLVAPLGRSRIRNWPFLYIGPLQVNK